MKSILTILLVILSSWGFSQEFRYIVSVVSRASQEQVWEHETARKVVADLLKDRCRIFDTAQQQQKIREMFAENPELDYSDIASRSSLENTPANLLINVKCRVEAIEDKDFPIYWHVAHMELKATDQRISSEIYALVQNTGKKILIPPQESLSLENWKSNPISKARAIEDVAKTLVPQLLQEMDKRQHEIQAFELQAQELTLEEKAALHKVLKKLADDLQISVYDVQDRLAGISAKVGYPQGLYRFLHILAEALQQNEHLNNFLCNSDGVAIQISRKPQQTLSEKKFLAKVIVSQDPLLAKTAETLSPEMTYTRDALHQALQNSLHIYDATSVWEKIRFEAEQFQESAYVRPNDFLNRQFNTATHILYFWATTRFTTTDIGEYCLANVQIRFIEKRSGEEIARFSSSSDAEASGVLVYKTRDFAQQQAISILINKMAKQLVAKLETENPTAFATQAFDIAFSAGGFSSGQLQKIREAFYKLRQQQKITTWQETDSGESYVSGHFRFAKDYDYLTFQRDFIVQAKRLSIFVELRKNGKNVLISLIADDQ